MSLNSTPNAERIHIGFFGMRNAGKSSLVNAVTGQSLSVVSDVKGTTTDPVTKAMELLPLGPVVIIDTPGIDDEGDLGELRVKKARQILAKTDIAVLVADATRELTEFDRQLISYFEEAKLPYIIAYNKCDIAKRETKANEICVSALTGESINELKEKIASLNPKTEEKYIVADLLTKGDTVVLVTPIDESAPKGRLILPQQNTIREIIDHGCIAVVCQPEELKQTLESVKPKLVITDSQVFGKVAKILPDDITLTSFSILFARYKGELEELVKGASLLQKLKKSDRILISEGCTHHRQCNDIGTVKMPGWIRDFCGEEIEFDFTSGGEFPEDLSGYALIVHCGGCMLNEKEMKRRISAAKAQGTPIVNYGVAIAHMHGILKQALGPFPEIQKLL
ncbi:MAG: [Clostridia bacterium]|nr:[FeFe] hydrogenase H-cluster maturation GTPase HydF [Clostridia bacterium]